MLRRSIPRLVNRNSFRRMPGSKVDEEYKKLREQEYEKSVKITPPKYLNKVPFFSKFLIEKYIAWQQKLNNSDRKTPERAFSSIMAKTAVTLIWIYLFYNLGIECVASYQRFMTGETELTSCFDLRKEMARARIAERYANFRGYEDEKQALIQKDLKSGVL